MDTEPSAPALETAEDGPDRLTGIVKWFNHGIGYIKQDNGAPDLFIHYTNIDMEGFRVVYPKDRVSFVPDTSDKGPIAKQIRQLKRRSGGQDGQNT